MIVEDLIQKKTFGSQALLNLDKKLFYWKPIFIILMSGRLGNLMFEYALLLRLRSEYPKYRGYLYRDEHETDKTGYDFDLMCPFNIPSSDFASKELVNYVKAVPFSCKAYLREKGFAMRQSLILSDALVTICYGYWQSESFFEDIKPLVRKAFRFNQNLLNIQTKQFSEKILSECVIGVHIRRGDYIEPHNIAMYGHICSYKYYIQALKLITDKIAGDYFIYFFTDDPEWVKANNPFLNSLVVDWNQGSEYWQDMYLMSLCHHNIIANSTFSWWGAWLNAYEDKIVVAPYRCFNTLWTPNIHPKEWKKIFPKGNVESDFVKQVEKNEIIIDRDGLFYGKVGVAIYLFHYAQVNHDPFYELIAMNLLNRVFERLTTTTSLDYADGLTGIGTAIEYLCQNGLVDGDSNEILGDVDVFFDELIGRPNSIFKLQDGLLGFLRYYRFRYMGQLHGNKEKLQEQFEKKIRCMLNMLCLDHEHWAIYFDNIVSELYELYLLNILPSQVNDLLNVILSVFANNFSEVISRASEICEKRVDTILFENTPGLKGVAGKELKNLPPIFKINWIKLM